MTKVERGCALGKCKQRMLSRCKSFDKMIEMSRLQAVELASEQLFSNPHSTKARRLISLFGLSEEELSESGVSYEVLRSLNALMI